MRELPEIKDSSVNTLSLGTSLDTRMPSMPSGELNDLSYTDDRRLEAEKLMNEMRVVYDITRKTNNRSKARAKARNRQAQKKAERR